LLFSDEEEKAAQSGVKPAAKKAGSAKGTSELGRTPAVEESGKVDSFFLVSSVIFVSQMFL